MYCYGFGFVLLMLTKYHECEESEGVPTSSSHSKHFMFNEKEWLTVYIIICLCNFAKDHLSSKIDLWYDEGELSYHQRKMARICLWLVCEGINISW